MSQAVKFASLEDFRRMVRAVRAVEARPQPATAPPNAYNSIGARGLFEVQLVPSGSSSSACPSSNGITYTVKDLSGNTLATNVTPEMTRPAWRTSGATHGLARYNQSGTLILVWCDETPLTTCCS